jgi:hypothetical protein
VVSQLLTPPSAIVAAQQFGYQQKLIVECSSRHYGVMLRNTACGASGYHSASQWHNAGESVFS